VVRTTWPTEAQAHLRNNARDLSFLDNQVITGLLGISTRFRAGFRVYSRMAARVQNAISLSLGLVALQDPCGCEHRN